MRPVLVFSNTFIESPHLELKFRGLRRLQSLLSACRWYADWSKRPAFTLKHIAAFSWLITFADLYWLFTHPALNSMPQRVKKSVFKKVVDTSLGGDKLCALPKTN
jgi:hypothetical protein